MNLPAVSFDIHDGDDASQQIREISDAPDPGQFRVLLEIRPQRRRVRRLVPLDQRLAGLEDPGVRLMIEVLGPKEFADLLVRFIVEKYRTQQRLLSLRVAGDGAVGGNHTIAVRRQQYGRAL